MEKTIDFLIKYVWQFPQMLAALIWYLIKKKKILYNSVGKFYTVYVGANRGGVTLGDRIFISKCYHGEYLNLIIAHESGHVLQSKYLGPLYLIVIGIPSILWAWLHKYIVPNKNAFWFYTESWANKLGGVAVGSNGVLTWRHLVKK